MPRCESAFGLYWVTKMFGPGEYRPDPTEGLTRVENLPAPLVRVRRRKDNEATFDARQQLHAIAGVALTAIEGIEESTALVVMTEIGTDMSRWPSEKHFGSWLGLAPNPKKSLYP